MVPASTPDASTADGSVDGVAWHADPDPRPQTLLRYAGVGLFGGVALCALALLAFVTVSTLAGGGDADALVLFATLLLVGGPFSLLYLWVAAGVAGTDRLREILFDAYPAAGDFSLRRALVASVVTAVGLVAALRVAAPLVPAYLVALVLGRMVVAARHSVGELDPETGTLVLERSRRHEFDVAGLSSVRHRRIGDYVVCWLGYDTGGLRNPHLLVVPADAFPAVETALDRLAAAETDATSTSRAARGALVALGLLFLGVAAAVALLARGEAAAPAVAYGVLVLGGLGALLVALAWAA